MPDRSDEPQRTVPPQRRRTVVVPEPTPMPPLPTDPVARRRVIRQRRW
ncbi:hypothetical protein [Streptomyces heilongjiangensis]|uniref:Uncharacterized protein n=1 Tax=Streptomyces heilongjiangensis TaxID=945052 RepID=A0ABW1BHQ5_9ACTN|nr:hypothetical protein [Streptomyces heilongjiangensis]MDC2951038.1 hypothetical protein [Streptomyces heilongjiangensis]